MSTGATERSQTPWGPDSYLGTEPGPQTPQASSSSEMALPVCHRPQLAPPHLRGGGAMSQHPSELTKDPWTRPGFESTCVS